jgi:CHAD domain-containing protein
MAYAYILNSINAVTGLNFLKTVQNNLNVIKETKQQGPCHYFDTFDWRLFRQGYYLYHFNDYLYLYQHRSKKIEDKQEYYFTSVDNIVPHDGDLQKKISAIIGIRAILCKATFQLTKQSFRILNRYEKTIARIDIEQGKIKEKSRYKSLQPYFEIRPVRGYANQVPTILNKLSLREFSISQDDLLKRGLAISGKIAADYSSKLSINLKRDMSAQEATKQIYISLLDIIQRNEFGLIQDIDTEFLHDFRVSIRRTRSGLGQIKGVLDEKRVVKAKDNFSFLGRSTNKLRDIDVYLLREKQYKLMLPLELRQYLNPFFEDLHQQRIVEHRAVVTTLKSAKYKRIISDWRTYLLAKETRAQPKSPSARKLAQNIIMKRNKKVLKFGHKILTTGSDDLLHQLRIEGKKLRYLLEFFSSLFAQEKINFLVGNLKILQDNLGEINDLFVQQRRLFDSAKEIFPRNRTEKNAVLALGILIGKLNEKQQIIKKEFSKSFSQYADFHVQKIFDELFKAQGRRVQ